MKIGWFLFLLSLFSCNETTSKQNENKRKTASSANGINYNFNSPASIWQLPSSLNEVSGIALLNDSVILCQEDEHGKIYLFNLKTSRVGIEISFGTNDDYEDICLLDNVVYLINSKGTIFIVANYLKQPVVSKYNTCLSQKNNTEGLCYDSETNSLLIACKEEQGSGVENKNEKIVYQFSLETKQIAQQPLLIFNEKNFKPSAIAVHPITKNIFVLSASKEKLLELTRDGSTVTMYELKKSMFPQPEGLAFANNGDLFIANEAAGGVATILLFQYKKNMSKKSKR